MAKSKNTPRSKAAKRRRNKTSIITETITAPAAGSVIINRRNNGPSIYSKSTNNISGHFVKNCERLAGISTVALGAFFTQRLALHPGRLGWLSTLSPAFSKYKWHFLKIIYIPICPTSTSGLFIGGLGYDFADNAPTTSVQAQQANRSVTSPVYGGFNGAHELNSYTKQRTPGAVSIIVDVDHLGGATGQTYYRNITEVNLGLVSPAERNFYAGAYIDASVEGGLALAVGHLFLEYVVEFIEPISPAVNN